MSLFNGVRMGIKFEPMDVWIRWCCYLGMKKGSLEKNIDAGNQSKAAQKLILPAGHN